MSCLDPFDLASERVWNIWRLGKWSLGLPEALCLQKTLLPGWRQQPSLPEMRRGSRNEDGEKLCQKSGQDGAYVTAFIWMCGRETQNLGHQIPHKSSLSFLELTLFSWASGQMLPPCGQIAEYRREKKLEPGGWGKASMECVQFFANVFWRAFGLWNQTLFENNKQKPRNNNTVTFQKSSYFQLHRTFFYHPNKKRLLPPQSNT